LPHCWRYVPHLKAIHLPRPFLIRLGVDMADALRRRCDSFVQFLRSFRDGQPCHCLVIMPLLNAATAQ
jgi:hypothetical protein